jgi:hypothetical protein
MRTKIAALAMPLIVLAGMRRCPQMRDMPCMGCGSEGDAISQVLILTSVLVLASIAFFAFKRRQAL